jgi:hypothetical protein
MAEMPPEVLQRSQWGFYSWWAGRPDDPFPDEFVQMAALMGAELPGYFRKAEFLTTGQIITAEGAAAIYEGEAFPWTTHVPMIALDGRLVRFVSGKWGLDIQHRFSEIQSLADTSPSDEIYQAIVYGHNLLMDAHLQNTSVLEALATEALGARVPTWGSVRSGMTEEAGAAMPMYVMVPATVLEDWASMLIDTAAFIEDARISIESEEAVGLVAESAEEASAEAVGGVRGPVLVAIAAIGLTAFGMVVAVVTGRVSRGTQIQ